MLKVLTLTGGIRLQQCPVLLTHNHLQTIDGLPSSRAIQIGLPNLQRDYIFTLYCFMPHHCKCFTSLFDNYPHQSTPTHKHHP